MLHQPNNKPFWRKEPFTYKEKELLDALFTGHREATKRQNVSSEILQAVYMVTGDVNKSVSSAILTLGGIHAPIVEAYDNIHYAVTPPPPWFATTKVAGWGNSFVKGKPDPIWSHTHEMVKVCDPAWTWKIDKITNYLHDLGKFVYPNAACYTAVTASIIKMPREISPILVHYGRLMTWAELIYNLDDTQRQSPKKNLRDKRERVCPKAT